MGATSVPTLVRHRAAWSLFDLCPFCTEVGHYAAMTGLELATRRPSLEELHRLKAPLPILEHEGRVVHEAPRIIAHLKSRDGDPLDRHLSATARFEGLALRTLLAETLYWVIIQVRWLEPAFYERYVPVVFDDLPESQRDFVPSLTREAMRKQIAARTVGRYSPEENLVQAGEIFEGLAATLAGRRFVLGDSPSSFDATVSSFLAHVLRVPIENPLGARAKKSPALEAYLDRLENAFPSLRTVPKP